MENSASTGLMGSFAPEYSRKVLGEIEYKDLPEPVTLVKSDGSFKLTLQDGEKFEGEWY